MFCADPLGLITQTAGVEGAHTLELRPERLDTALWAQADQAGKALPTGDLAPDLVMQMSESVAGQHLQLPSSGAAGGRGGLTHSSTACLLSR